MSTAIRRVMPHRRSWFAVTLVVFAVVFAGCAHPSTRGTPGARQHDEPAPADASEPVPIDGRDQPVPDGGVRGAVADDGFRCDVYDPKNPACKAVCPGPGALSDACQKCPSPPDPDLVACQRVMACPDPPDRRVRACRPHHSFEAGEVQGRVLKVEAVADGVLLVIGVGSSFGIDLTWRAAVLVGDTDQRMAHGEVALVRVSKVVTVGKLHLTVGQLGGNYRVSLVPR